MLAKRRLPVARKGQQIETYVTLPGPFTTSVPTDLSTSETCRNLRRRKLSETENVWIAKFDLFAVINF
jgi:hypothetical protein